MIKSCLDHGNLVPDRSSWTCCTILSWPRPRPDGYILGGFPRTVELGQGTARTEATDYMLIFSERHAGLECMCMEGPWIVRFSAWSV